MIGTRLAHYEITGHLGTGGMGVVYQATDSKLGRSVAIKLLPDAVTHDAERAARFEREARVLASLNHPNIAAIYGIEEFGGRKFLVMELVTGETLAEKISRGKIPVEEAVSLATQIAEALEVAHEKGIIHRDLKPANVKVTPEGRVKVLDFGLAKAFEQQESIPSLSNSPTLSMNATQQGSILGTAAYMSPEQASGKPVDARTDIWAFGCVLYEMLTARQTFQAETVTETLARIIEGQPNWNLLPPNTSPSIRLLLKAALNKNPKQRLQHIGDSRILFDKGAEEFLKPLPSALASKPQTWMMAALLGLALIASLTAAALYLRRPTLTVEDYRYEMPVPELLGTTLTISPNGEQFAYLAFREGTRAIWIQSIGKVKPTAVPGTENATGGHFWSPDSRFIAFFAEQKLKKVNLAEGSVTVLGPADITSPGAWNASGDILYTRLLKSSGLPAIVRISDKGGGEPVPVVEQDPSELPAVLIAPQFLPDGRHFIFRRVVGNAGSSGRASVMIGSLDPGTATEATSLPAFGSNVRYATDFLFFLQNGVLVAQRFDLKSLKLLGDPMSLAEPVSNNFAVADNGRLVYQQAQQAQGAQVATNQLQWFDRTGTPLERLGSPSTYGSVEISPDGLRVAVDRLDSGRDIYTIDVGSGAVDRLTTDNAPDVMPVWEPPGGKDRIVFASQRGDTPSRNPKLFTRSSSSIGGDSLLFQGALGEGSLPMDWSTDGRYIVFMRRVGASAAAWNLWIHPMMDGEKPIPYLETPFRKTQAQISPNQKWLAYVTNETGGDQIVVQTFPNSEAGRVTVTANGGTAPRWKADSSELYYIASDGKLMAVEIKQGPTFALGQTKLLFPTNLPTQATVLPILNAAPYDVAPDGKRFLLITPLNARAPVEANSVDPLPVSVILDWRKALAKQ